MKNSATVVIPNLNGMSYLDDCLKSLAGNGSIAEVIIVDNHSADQSVEFIRRHYPDVTLICLDENTGFAAAVNIGIKRAATEYVILLNNDTRVEPDFAAALIRAINSSDQIFSAGAKMLNMQKPDTIDDAGDFYCALGWAYARGRDKAARLHNKKTYVFSACAGAAIYRKSMMEQIGYFDENHFAYLEDVDIGYRAQLYGYRNIYAADAVVYHAGSATSGSRYNLFKTRLTARNSIYLIYKNMPALQIFLNLPFLIPGFLVKILFFIKKGMGQPYLQGLAEGIRLAAGRQGRLKKVRFRPECFQYYMSIQWQLWQNTILRFFY